MTRRLLAVVVGSGALLAVSLSGSARAAAPPIPWHTCAGASDRGFQCATIHVPLDYGHPRLGTIRLAVIRHPGSDRRRRLGTLFYEPGGPGTPGVGFLPIVVRGGLFPAPLLARFDVVSWDPRGVGASTAVRCFVSVSAENRFFAGSPRRSVDGFPAGRLEMMTWIEGYRRLGAVCKRRDGPLLAHVSTVDTVRDLDLMRQRAGDRMLNYLGTSYGTEVGAVYANMFPRRVRAMVLDGNINPVAWSHPQIAQNGGRFLSAGLRFHADGATSKALAAFLDLCGRADTAHCAFSAGSPKATREKFNALLARMPLNPRPGQTSYSQTISKTISALYFTAQWKDRAIILQRLWEKGPSAVKPPTGAGYEEQEMAIACAEVPSPAARAFPGMDAFARRRSGVVGPYWAWDYEPCSTWPVRATHRYAGPWNRRTANPVLVVGTTLDPATPYRGALAMTRLLARTRLLTVNGYGHSALYNPSSCVNRSESRYFIDRTLPPKGTTCTQDQTPFGG